MNSLWCFRCVRAFRGNSTHQCRAFVERARKCDHYFQEKHSCEVNMTSLVFQTAARVTADRYATRQNQSNRDKLWATLRAWEVAHRANVHVVIFMTSVLAVVAFSFVNRNAIIALVSAALLSIVFDKCFLAIAEFTNCETMCVCVWARRWGGESDGGGFVCFFQFFIFS